MRSARRWRGIGFVLTWTLLSAPVYAQVRSQQESANLDGEAAPTPAPATASMSVGIPDRGRLTDSVILPESEHLFIRESQRAAQYGTAELVGLVSRVAAAVAEDAVGSKLVVGDLSRERGRRLPPHRSHQSGRDADLGFYLIDEAGAPAQPAQFVNLRRNGCGRVATEVFCFDAPRNWAMITAIVRDSTLVQYVLIAPDLRRRLLEEGERSGAPQTLIERVALVTEPHAGSNSHRSHFHVRIYCPEADRPACIDEAPFHPWYVGEPAPVTTSVRRIRTQQRRVRARQQRRQAARRAQARATRRARAAR